MAYRLLSTVKKLENNLLIGTKQFLILRNKSVSKQLNSRQNSNIHAKNHVENEHRSCWILL